MSTLFTIIISLILGGIGGYAFRGSISTELKNVVAEVKWHVTSEVTKLKSKL